MAEGEAEGRDGVKPRATLPHDERSGAGLSPGATPRGARDRSEVIA